MKTTLKYMVIEMFREIHTSNIQPKLEYAKTVWSSSLKTYRELLERVLRNATTMVSKWNEV